MKKTFATLILLCVFASHGAIAQATSIHQSGNHVSLSSDLTINQFQTFDLGIGSTYSIAGVLDLGFTYAAALAATDEYWTNVGLTYAVTPVKQRGMDPVSLQIYGSYVFRTIQSEFLSDNRLTREGAGYTVGLVLSRRFRLGPTIGLDLGALAEFGRRTDITSLTFVYDPASFVGEPDIDYAEYPVVDRVSLLQFGGRVAVSYLSPRHHSLGVEVAALFDSTRAFKLRPGINVALGR